MNLAGKGFTAGILVNLTIACCYAQAPVAVTPQPTSMGSPIPRGPATVAADKESSLTVPQIVARQEDHFKRIQNAQGTAVHTEVRYGDNGLPAAKGTQFIFFAYEGDRSVTLAMPQAAAQFYKSSQGVVPWKDIISAYHVAGDAVYVIAKPEKSGTTTGPTVLAVPFNPAVHENNPIVRFHPRQISDEQAPLRDLAKAIPNMAERPRVLDIMREGKPMLRVEFANPNVPGDRLTYIIDPNRGYLPAEIVHLRDNKMISASKIVIGNTPDGTWIPARRERTTYGPNGKPASLQTWHYDFLAINKKLPPKMLSLMYFNLPLTTAVKVVKSADMAPGPSSSPQATPQSPARSASPPPVTTPRPMPMRQAPPTIKAPLK